MAAWGRDRGEIPDLEFYRMLTAYTRRKTWEAKVQAIEIWNLLGEAMGSPAAAGSGELQRMAGSLAPKAGVRVAEPETVLRMAGVKI